MPITLPITLPLALPVTTLPLALPGSDLFTRPLAGVLAGAHHVLTGLGLPGDAGVTWGLSVLLLVAAVRSVLLPLTVLGVRSARAAGRAAPQLAALTEQYAGRTDRASLTALSDERRRINAEHGVSRWGCLSALAQIPLWLSLYHLIGQVSNGSGVGPLDVGLAASFSGAAMLGVGLAQRGYLGAGAGHLTVVLGLAGTVAALGYLTQRFLVAPNTATDHLPQAVLQAQHLMPVLAGAGVLVAATVAPVGVLVYWLCNATWTLGQTAVITRWFPTPGTPAAQRS